MRWYSWLGLCGRNGKGACSLCVSIYVQSMHFFCDYNSSEAAG